jgi:hypothetical protein
MQRKFAARLAKKKHKKMLFIYSIISRIAKTNQKLNVWPQIEDILDVFGAYRT